MSRYKTSIIKRGIGVLLALSPFALAIISLFAQSEPFLATISIIAAFLALAFAVLNSWLSFLRPVLWERRHGNIDDYKFVSGLPGVGTFLAILATVTGFGGTAPSTIALIALALDTGSVPWFVFATWRDKSMWDTEEQQQGEQGGDGDAEEAV
ncbi:hypothetical protein [Luteolibacter sp. AS25]|uniref:hypothetical protein n=1 Tax=Luteolibacter sp. AS25 TaxID=3135776 RepID=UPI00398A7C55